MSERGFIALALGVFFLLELIFKIKLGSLFILGIAWSLLHQWLSVRTGGGKADHLAITLFALQASLIVCSLLFAILAILNAAARTVDPAWTWFQLP